MNTEARNRHHPLCHHPERYTSEDNQATEHVVTELVAAFVRALQPDIVIETGSYNGQTSAGIGKALALNGQGHLHTFEKDGHRSAVARERVKGLPVTVHTGVLQDFEPPGPVGFAFLDSLMGHRVPEFEYLRPRLVKGGIVAFHDTSPHHPLLRRLALRNVNIIHLPTPRGVSFVEPL